MVKNPPVNVGDLREMGSIPGSGRSLEEGMATLPGAEEGVSDEWAWRRGLN